MLLFAVLYFFIRPHSIFLLSNLLLPSAEQYLARALNSQELQLQRQHLTARRGHSIVDHTLQHQTSDRTTITNTMASNQHFFPRTYISETIMTAKSLTDNVSSSTT
jgi:hypothetical protein